MKKLITALFMLSVVGLSGCGQTGGLYFPEEPQTAEELQTSEAPQASEQPQTSE